METVPNRSSWSVTNPNSPWHKMVLVCVVVILSYCAAKLGGMLIIGPQAEWPLWLGNAFLASVLLLVPRSMWPTLMAADLAALFLEDIQAGLTIRSTALLILADTAEVLTAAFCLRYAFGGVPRLNSVRALAKFSLFGVLLAPCVGAFFIALATQGNYWVNWRISFFSEAIVYLTLMPAILGWLSQGPARVRARNQALITSKLSHSSQGWWLSHTLPLPLLGDTALKHGSTLSCPSCFGPRCVSEQRG
jgi:integral membrane sensor domain MASE1